MNENKLVVDLDTCRITLASETEEKNHVELEVNEGMNGDKEWFKQQIVKKYPSQSEIDNPNYEIIAKVEIINEALSLIDQLVELTLPKIPQFVADYLEDFKQQNLTLGDALDTHFEDDNQMHVWLYEDGEARNDETLAKAWIDGYKIEKEKQYFVKEPITRQFLIKDNRQSNGVKWTDGFEKDPSYYTEQEIKAIDERYLVFAEEVPNV